MKIGEYAAYDWNNLTSPGQQDVLGVEVDGSMDMAFKACFSWSSAKNPAIPRWPLRCAKSAGESPSQLTLWQSELRATRRATHLSLPFNAAPCNAIHPLLSCRITFMSYHRPTWKLSWRLHHINAELYWSDVSIHNRKDWNRRNVSGIRAINLLWYNIKLGAPGSMQ